MLQTHNNVERADVRGCQGARSPRPKSRRPSSAAPPRDRSHHHNNMYAAMQWRGRWQAAMQLTWAVTMMHAATMGSAHVARATQRCCHHSRTPAQLGAKSRCCGCIWADCQTRTKTPCQLCSAAQGNCQKLHLPSGAGHPRTKPNQLLVVLVVLL
jgi:hypothetical protein